MDTAWPLARPGYRFVIYFIVLMNNASSYQDINIALDTLRDCILVDTPVIDNDLDTIWLTWLC